MAERSEHEQIVACDSRILATLYGQCVGDAIGLLTEFLTKVEAKTYYGSVCKKLEFEHKKIVQDFHRERWEIGDWTDDSDQMILIMLSLIESGGKNRLHSASNTLSFEEIINNGDSFSPVERFSNYICKLMTYTWKEVDQVGERYWIERREELLQYFNKHNFLFHSVFRPGSTNLMIDAVDFGQRLKYWMRRGFSELGDLCGMGIGITTLAVLSHSKFDINPHQAAEEVWDSRQRNNAPNGAVMRTSVVGVYNFHSLDSVVTNALGFCKVTHADPRCQASVVAVSISIALMLGRNEACLKKNGAYNVDGIIQSSYKYASECLSTKDEKKELQSYLECSSLKWLKLDEPGKIGYTYKCLGAGFWALKQHNFRKAIQELVMEAGDADTNCSVAGAMLGCKLGIDAIPDTWKDQLCNRKWLDDIIQKFLMLKPPSVSS